MSLISPKKGSNLKPLTIANSKPGKDFKLKEIKPSEIDKIRNSAYPLLIKQCLFHDETGEHYIYKLVGTAPTIPFSDEYLERNSVYKFKSANKKVYNVLVQKFKHDIYIIKFYLSRSELNPNKYKELSNDRDAIKVFRTVLAICLDLFENDPNASFGFIGEPKKGEKTETTQRFRIYKRIAVNLFGSTRFKHYEDPKHNGYLLINTIHQNCDIIKDSAEKMFTTLFPGFQYQDIQLS